MALSKQNINKTGEQFCLLVTKWHFTPCKLNCKLNLLTRAANTSDKRFSLSLVTKVSFTDLLAKWKYSLGKSTLNQIFNIRIYNLNFVLNFQLKPSYLYKYYDSKKIKFILNVLRTILKINVG